MPRLIDDLLKARTGEEPTEIDGLMVRSDTPFGSFVFWAYNKSLLTTAELAAYATLIDAKSRLLQVYRRQNKNPALEEYL